MSVYGTSPVLVDTDGDGLSDHDEIVEYGFDPEVNPYRYNPLVADLPKLGGVLTSPPSVALHPTDSTGVSRTFETTHSTESAHTVSTSTTDSNSLAIEQTHTASGSVGLSPEGLSGSVSYSYSHSTTDETSHSFTEEQAQENRTALGNAEAFQKNRELSASGGILMVTVQVENRGNLSFRLDQLMLSAVMPDLSEPGVFHPIGNLQLDATYTSFPAVTIPPGGRLSALDFINDGLDLQTTKALLESNRGLVIQPAMYDLTDPDGRAFAFNLTQVSVASVANTHCPTP